jgi:hypothetical protein
VQQNLRGLFDRALDDEPLPPPGDPVHQAMTAGRRIRRRRSLLVGGSAATAVLAAVVSANLVLAPDGPPPPPVSANAALMARAQPGCTVPVTDRATDVAVFLRVEVTLEQITDLRDDLWTDPAVRDVRFESREQAYQNFKRLWSDSPDFVASVGPADLPQSFRVRLGDPGRYPQFARAFGDHAGVEDVVGSDCAGTGR